MVILLNNQLIEIGEQQAKTPLLNWLREQQGLVASKEGCGAGDCGACTLLVGRQQADARHYEAVNACLLTVGSLHGCHVLTLEGLALDGMHVVQQAMVEHHGSQCGFCTPGIVMALLAWWLQTPANDLATEAQRFSHRHAINQALGGNLCRCTGYEPIFNAAASLAPTCLGGNLTNYCLASLSQAEITQQLQSSMATASSLDNYYLPTDDEQLALAFNAVPDARVISGATDVGLEITQQLRQHEAYIDLSRLQALQKIEQVNGDLRIGAGVTFSQLEDYFSQHPSSMSAPWLSLLELLGSRQIRNRGTLGGNLANGSPIADTPPLLLALDAQLVLQQGQRQRHLPVREFFLGYRQTDLQAGEIIRQIRIPAESIGEQVTLQVSKVSKRQDDDISAACIALLTAKHKGKTVCRIGLGGMAATPALAPKTAELLSSGVVDKQTILAYLKDEFSPLDDVRASASYRLQVCANSLAYWAQQGDLS